VISGLRRSNVALELAHSPLASIVKDPKSQPRNKTRREKNDTSPSKKGAQQSIQCGCSFIMKYSNRLKDPKRPDNLSKGSVRMTSFCYRYSTGCKASASELTAHKLSSGEYAGGKLSIEKLVEFEEQKTFLNAQAMQNYL
jgi:hypothetical protein